MRAKARDVLQRLSTEGSGFHSRKALATFASLEFQDGNYASALGAYRRYTTLFPESTWTWVAWLRIGQCEQELGKNGDAVATFLEAAKRASDLPPARVLGQEYAARAHEAAGEFDKALVLHQRALADWDLAFGVRYSTFVRRPRKNDDPFLIERDVSEVTRESLPVRIAQLKRSLSMPGGSSFELGRWFVLAGKYQDAGAELQRFIARNPKSTLAGEARDMMHRARLERALQLADVENPARDEAAAMKELDALSREPVDFPVIAARIARASLLWKNGDIQAETVMTEALNDWHRRQPVVQPRSDLEQDVAQIRSEVFLPQGGGVYATGRWNAFSWSDATQQFLIANADVRVKSPDGDVTQITLPQNLAVGKRVLFFDTQQLSLLKQIVVKLGGTKRREPRQIMETPNQPIGDSMQLIRLWNRFFHARPGHWGGWEVETYPVITEIQFTNAARTKAAVRVTIGYSGGTVELEKENGTWIAKRLTNQWIT